MKTKQPQPAASLNAHTPRGSVSTGAAFSGLLPSSLYLKHINLIHLLKKVLFLCLQLTLVSLSKYLWKTPNPCLTHSEVHHGAYSASLKNNRLFRLAFRCHNHWDRHQQQAFRRTYDISAPTLSTICHPKPQQGHHVVCLYGMCYLSGN